MSSIYSRLLLNTFISDGRVGRRGYWILRLSVNLENLGCLEESLQTAEDGLLNPWVCAGSRVALQRRVLRLGKPPRRWKLPSYSSSIKSKIAEVHIQGKPLNCEAGMKSIFYSEDGDQCGVEQFALRYYAGEGGSWHGVHAESGIWLTIFGILLWVLLFRTKFQVHRIIKLELHDSFWGLLSPSPDPSAEHMEALALALLQTSPLDLESHRRTPGQNTGGHGRRRDTHHSMGSTHWNSLSRS